MDAILAFESAHHIPDRKKAMAGFSRVLKPAGRMVLAEPGAAHEHAQVSVDVMNKYGILEKGHGARATSSEYVAGTQMGRPEQIFLLRASERELGRRSIARSCRPIRRLKATSSESLGVKACSTPSELPGASLVASCGRRSSVVSRRRWSGSGSNDTAWVACRNCLDRTACFAADGARCRHRAGRGVLFCGLRPAF